jgi:hypothetical protein
MIVDNPNSHFIFVYHPFVLMGKKYTTYQGRDLTNREVLEYWGKWIILGERKWLDSLALKLDPYVEDKKIPCIKYDRNPSANLGIKECVFMVYCDRRVRDDVWDILKQHGARLKAWVTEKETMALWMPKSPLLERWMDSKGYDDGTKELVRKDAKERMAGVVNNPDAIFTGWEQ